MLQNNKIVFTAILCLFFIFLGGPIQAQKSSKKTTQKVVVDTAKNKAIAFDTLKPRLKLKLFHTLNTLESVSILQRKYMYLLREYTCISFSAVYTQHCCVHTAHTHVHIYIACSSLRIHHTAPLLQDVGERAIVVVVGRREDRRVYAYQLRAARQYL
jgi:hypothetical protein